jgi:hypothetical protein
MSGFDHGAEQISRNIMLYGADRGHEEAKALHIKYPEYRHS